ncbi:28 kDa ribonucleoprotein, chloroplastic [Coffea eugenioides]|uniref:28 kDa ribonucleoprotein, chloroplastic n=1 Tax=Coffea eugenioides TaxID=49369 RepID=UPI000F605C1C|nr:28 kDa ribonucleoprotein, chloroplastic [Coffea eugenioides]
MALLRLLHLPSCPTNFFCFHQNPSSASPQPFTHKPPTLNATLSFPSLSFKLPFKSQRFNLFEFQVPFSAQAQPITQNSENAEKDNQEEEEEDDEGEGEEEEFSKTRILAQNVPWTSTVDDLRPLFEKYGTVVDIELSMYNKTRNRGLAFVSMASHEEALAAFRNLESYDYQGRVLKLSWAKPKKIKPAAPPKPKTLPIHNLFVANLHFAARAKDLKEFFNANNGNVVSAEIIFQDNPRRSAGYGFVSFNTKEEAEAALVGFQGKEFMGRPIRVARSRGFLRPQTKADVQSDITTAKSNSLEN